MDFKFIIFAQAHLQMDPLYRATLYNCKILYYVNWSGTNKSN